MCFTFHGLTRFNVLSTFLHSRIRSCFQINHFEVNLSTQMVMSTLENGRYRIHKKDAFQEKTKLRFDFTTVVEIDKHQN